MTDPRSRRGWVTSKLPDGTPVKVRVMNHPERGRVVLVKPLRKD